MAIDIRERLNLEEECKRNNFLFREKTKLEETYYCKASLSILIEPELKVICPKFCNHHGQFYGISDKHQAYGHYLCNYVPKKIIFF